MDEAGLSWSLPWQSQALAEAASRQRGHALLVHASPGIGALEFAFSLARTWLCEGRLAPDIAHGPWACGHCGACRLAVTGAHPDLTLLLPETLKIERGLPFEPDERRKPSRQIRIDDVREAISWMTGTSARGRGKVLVLHPAEALNVTSASALLKTLEEPPGAARIVLTAAEPARLLPTVLSRCQRLRLNPPSEAEALSWLGDHGLAGADAAVLLRGAGGQPLRALAWHRDGVTGSKWTALPEAVARDDASVLSAWPVSRLLEALQMLCHDASVQTAGGSPRYFPARAIPMGASLPSLIAWHKSLQRVMAHADHPWSEPLLVEALVAEGAQAWARPAGRRTVADAADTLSP